MRAPYRGDLARTVAHLRVGQRVRITIALNGRKVVGTTFAWGQDDKILLVTDDGVDIVVRRIDGTPGRFIANVEPWDRDSLIKRLREDIHILDELDAELAACTTSEMGEVRKRIDEQQQAIADEWLRGVAS